MDQPVNEPIMGYAPGSPEREALQNEIQQKVAKLELERLYVHEGVYYGEGVS